MDIQSAIVSATIADRYNASEKFRDVKLRMAEALYGRAMPGETLAQKIERLHNLKLARARAYAEFAESVLS